MKPIDGDDIATNVKPTTPPLNSQSILESQIQRDVIRWSKSKAILRDYLIHIPNGGKRSKRSGFFLKQMGLKAGVSDLFLAYPKGRYHGLWIELKTPGNKLSQEQKHWLQLMKQAGYAVYVAYSRENAINILERYLRL